MTNDLQIRCRFCPRMTTGAASGPLLARYERHLRNCAGARRVATERGLRLDAVVSDTLMRSGVADGPSAAADPLPDWTEKLLQKNPMLEAAGR